MFRIALDSDDRMKIWEAAKKEPAMCLVRDALSVQPGWFSTETESFQIGPKNLERYLQHIHGVYIMED